MAGARSLLLHIGTVRKLFILKHLDEWSIEKCNVCNNCNSNSIRIMETRGLIQAHMSHYHPANLSCLMPSSMKFLPKCIFFNSLLSSASAACWGGGEDGRLEERRNDF